MKSVDLITYDELLEILENSNSNHLLLGNGFNNSLGIGTNYSQIFKQMKKEYPNYKEIENVLKKNNYDIEWLILHLKEKIEDNSDKFLYQYIERKVKFDFMKAANEIVQDSIKSVYKEKNGDIHILLDNFTNYFTLNYDPFLYLLLLKFKKSDIAENYAVGVQNTFSFIQDDLDNAQNEIYEKIKEARQNGTLNTNIGNVSKTIDLSKSNKTYFQSSITKHFSDENWSNNDIKIVCNKIWEDENNEPKLSVNDGFLNDNYILNNNQNLYFLHGAFHIIEKNKKIKKIKSTQNEAFCRKLEDAISSENNEIVCIFTNDSEDKKKHIEKNSYLNKCFMKLSMLHGNLVILGSSLAKNDQHIFNQINKSSVDNIYVSSCEKSKMDDYQKALELFKDKQVVLFDYTTISYTRGNLG